jgi:hypothetical protein
VHEALEIVENEVDVDKHDFFEEISALLRNRLEILKPSESVTFFFDGGAAQAKVHQQRERRLKRCLSGKKRETFRNFLTAGTPLMRDFEDFFALQVDELRRLYPQVTFSIDGTWNAGEGEHKIRDALRQCDKSKRICIYGKDGDLLFISLLTQIDTMIFGGHGLSKTNFDLYDTGTLRRSLLGRFKGNKKNDANVIADVCLLLINLGNDYVRYNFPSITLSSKRKFSSICDMFDLYAEFDDYLINLESLLACEPQEATPGKIFHLQNFIRFLGKFQSHNRLTHRLMKSTVRNGQYHVQRFLKQDDHPLTRASLCKHTELFWKEGTMFDMSVDGKKNSWYKRIVQAPIKGDRMTDEETFNVCESYWITLCWTIVTYSIGVPSWKHTYTYHNAPFLQDFLRYLRTQPDIRWNTERYCDPYPYLTRLLSILPLDTIQHLWPDQIKEIHSIFSDAGVNAPDISELTIGGSPNVSYATGITNLPHIDPELMIIVSQAVYKILPEHDQIHFSSYPSTVIADFVSEIPLSPLDDSGSEPEPAELDPVGRESLETLDNFSSYSELPSFEPPLDDSGSEPPEPAELEAPEHVELESPEQVDQLKPLGFVELGPLEHAELDLMPPAENEVEESVQCRLLETLENLIEYVGLVDIIR